MIRPKGEAAFTRLYHHHRSGAKWRKIKFNLTKKQFREIVTKNCFYCGVEPFMSAIKRTSRQCNGDFIYTGVDRIDSRYGYSIKNCVPCCIHCNRAKSEMSVQDFLNLVKNIYNNRIKKEN